MNNSNKVNQNHFTRQKNQHYNPPQKSIVYQAFTNNLDYIKLTN